MKAVIYSRYGAPDLLRIAEIAKPVPAGNEVLIKVHAVAKIPPAQAGKVLKSGGV